MTRFYGFCFVFVLLCLLISGIIHYFVNGCSDATYLYSVCSITPIYLLVVSIKGLIESRVERYRRNINWEHNR